MVEQRLEEGTAEDLYKQIQAEKHALIKVGKIRKEKPLPEITEDEIPFEIPERWKWVRFGDCGTLKSGFAFKSSEYAASGIQVVRISDLAEDRISYNDAVYYSPSALLKPYLITKNSFLICLTGSIGKMAWVQDDTPRYLNQRVGMFEPLMSCDSSYLWWFLHNGMVLNQWIGAKTSTNGNIKNSDVTELLCPLPPLAEQKRIVAKIEELLPLIERYEKAWNRLEDFNKRFPVDMQKSILQMAIQGKLVEQRPEEGTGEELYRRIQAEKQALIKAGKIKKEKPLPEITEDEIPFEIPESWKWVRLREIVDSDISYGIIKLGNEDENGVRVLRCSDVKENRIIPEGIRTVSRELSQEYERTVLSGGEIVINVRGTLGGCAVVPNSMRGYNVAREVAVIRQCQNVSAQYIVFILMSGYFQSFMFHGLRGIAYKGLNMSTLSTLPVPLPPHAEQKRIVARLKELLPLCERLK